MPNLPYQSAGWSTHSEVKLREIDYPLEGEQSHFIVTRTYEGPKATYSDLALNTADDEFATAYFVRQGPLVDVDGGCVRYERTFSTVPAQWSDFEEFAFPFPAYTVGIAFGTIYSVTAAADVGANCIMNTNAAAVSIGDSVFLDLNYVRANANYHVTMITPATQASTGTTVGIAKVLPGQNVYSAVTGTIRKGQVGRTLPETLIVGSRLQYDYALSSESTIDADLPIMEKFSPTIPGTGYVSDTLNASTLPSATTYNSMIDAGTEIVAERSRRRRYRGNIYQRITRLVKAA